MGFERRIEGPASVPGEPIGGLAGVHEKRRVGRSAVVATGTLACPLCDAPVALFAPVATGAPLACPVCQHTAPVRDFLSLGEPRPARVEVRVVVRADEPYGVRDGRKKGNRLAEASRR